MMDCLEPACGRGHMARALLEYFDTVRASDKYSYRTKSEKIDFLKYGWLPGWYDWIITNPPFNLAEEFVLRSLEVASRGVAILARTNFLESVGRYERIFKERPPTVVAPFVERVPMVRGRCDPEASTATSYAWFVWRIGATDPFTRLHWIPPCRRELERDGDYV